MIVGCASGGSTPVPRTETAYVVIEYVADADAGAFAGGVGELPAQLLDDLVSEQTLHAIESQILTSESPARTDGAVSRVAGQLHLSTVSDPYQAIAVAATNTQGDRAAAQELADAAAGRLAAIARDHPLLAAGSLPTDSTDVLVTVTNALR